ncbi:hypothetical protein [Nitratifractor salsuginis]|uniref:hypothetical protein n=1 Tax=Nitratifractor salsuginis TaxID=269261 RepID=UPI0011D12B85|nr:hypothetical protein [Nitratifractor salsuginis]
MLSILAVGLSACADTRTPPADIWGGVGFVYESGKNSGVYKKGGAAAVGFEKRLSSGLGFGGEVAGY